MLLRLYDDNNSYEDLQQIVNLLNDGGTFIFPTGGRYAMGCHALKQNAVEAICKIKGINPEKNRLSIIGYDLSSISDYAKVDNVAFKLMKKNLPGPFTFILTGTNRLPKIFNHRKEVGIRMPACSIIMEIVQLLEAPVLTASLPVPEGADEEYFTDPELIEEMFGERVDLVIDGGLGQNYQTTVVDCTQNPPEIVRQAMGELKF